MKIFVVLGSQKFQFNRLLKRLDEIIVKNDMAGEVLAQIGYSDYQPIHYSHREFFNQEDFLNIMSQSDIVITHGGAGTIFGALKMKKKVLAVPRLSKYKEHVDNHQLQLLEEFEKIGLIEVCYELEQLEECFQSLLSKNYQKYESNTGLVVREIDTYLQKVYLRKG
ncbi:multidrug MFS transporter [Clostridia bacterium]|nr:multidrug MFS transporter [Clostridia bacterium]